MEIVRTTLAGSWLTIPPIRQIWHQRTSRDTPWPSFSLLDFVSLSLLNKALCFRESFYLGPTWPMAIYPIVGNFTDLISMVVTNWPGWLLKIVNWSECQFALLSNSEAGRFKLRVKRLQRATIHWFHQRLRGREKRSLSSSIGWEAKVVPLQLAEQKDDVFDQFWSLFPNLKR